MDFQVNPIIIPWLLLLGVPATGAGALASASGADGTSAGRGSELCRKLLGSPSSASAASGSLES